MLRPPPELRLGALRTLRLGGRDREGALETLDRDVLSWKGVDLSSLRIADRDALGELGACSDRLPCFILQKGPVRHLAHGVPTDLNLKEMDRCTRR